jgi:hypothetical protein
MNFEEILLELSYRVPEGIVNLTKESHINTLVEILKENGVDNANEVAQKARVYFSYISEVSLNEAPKLDAGLQAAIEFYKGKKYKNNKGTEVTFSTAIQYGYNGNENDKAHIAAMADFEAFLNANKGKYGDMETAKQPEEEPEQPTNAFGVKGPGAKVFPDKPVKEKPAKPKKEKPLPASSDMEDGESDNISTTNPYVKPGQKVTDPKKVKELMQKDTDKVIKALSKTKSQELADKERAKKSGVKLGVGAGTAASRAGECAVVYGGKKLTEMINKGVSFDKAIGEIEKDLRKIAGKSDTLLDDAWVDSAVSTLSYIQQNINFKNIKEFTWDTDEGRAVVGSEGHGTSSDCFMQLKDGSRLGLSLKKDLSVFVFSGGMGDMMNDLASKGMQNLPTLNDYKDRRTQELSKLTKLATNSKTIEDFQQDFNDLKKNPEGRFGAKGLSNRLQSIEKLTGKPLSKLTFGEFAESILSDVTKGDNIKILADMAKTSSNPKIKEIYKNVRGLDKEMTFAIKEQFTNPANKHVVDEIVRKETHIDDILFPENKHLDRLMVVYGEEPAIEMKKENLVSLLGIDKEMAMYENEKDPAKKAKLKDQLNDKINSQIKVTDKGGVMSVGIDIGGGSIIPIFEARVRTRGIGSAPTFEMPQSRFGGLAFKNGTTDFKKWKDPNDRIDVVTSMSKELLNDFEDLDMSDKQTRLEVIDRIKRLNEILPEGAKNKALTQVALKAKEYKLS